MSDNFAAIVAEAHAAGRQAAMGFTPIAMIVGQAKSLFSDEIDYSQPTEYVADGVCGFAWVRFAGNTAFGRWAKKVGVARDAYPKGLQIWISDYNQSMQRKEVHARAFAEVLNKHGIRAWSESRMD